MENQFSPQQETRFEAIEEKVELINSNIEKILEAFNGNRITGKGGLVQEIRNLEIKIEQSDSKLSKQIETIDSRLKPVELFMNKIVWTIFIIGGICTVVGALIGLVFTYYSLKK